MHESLQASLLIHLVKGPPNTFLPLYYSSITLASNHAARHGGCSTLSLCPSF